MQLHDRVCRALARQGLDVSTDGHTWRVRWRSCPHAPVAEALLPRGGSVEGRALRQLADLAAVAHPEGGAVQAVRATPDLHPGRTVPIGSVVHTTDMLIPAAVGGDINCGMRLHVTDVSVDRFLAIRDPFVEALKGDLFFGTREIVLPARAAAGLYTDGLAGLLLSLEPSPRGVLGHIDREQWFDELDRVLLGGGLPGDLRWVPPGLAPDRGEVRDGGLATIGGGNHFVEIGVVEEILDASVAYAWGVRRGQLSILVHSGSRNVGRAIGGLWRDQARSSWPTGHPYPPGELFPLIDPDQIRDYLSAEATAANYGFLNRALLAELVRVRLRERLGDLTIPLIFDLPHNLTFSHDPGWITRKGACPAHDGQPVIVPGSMGTASYLAVGRGSEAHLCSASHGAGRQLGRFEMTRRGSRIEQLGLEGVDCVTLRQQRVLEEAPAAYKPIDPVIEAQVEARILDPVARLRPVLTFKG